jgi:serine/threonine protein kinase
VAAEHRRVGPWTLGEELGAGGNAKVYRARDEGGREVALKVLDNKRVGGEPYRRFVQEIRFLRSLGPFPGVLPFIETYLPDTPIQGDAPWLAMPIATPITRALLGGSLETVVGALAQIAQTLARLAERGVGHRDVKPGNLYELGGEWLIGDFGLVAAPEADDDITRAGKALGPSHFIAYEMIVDAVNADPLLADVYSFGKTTWSLITGLPYPPHGHQPANSRQWSIRELRPDPRASALDHLVDRATQLTPRARPTMAELARDLRAWSQLGVGAPPIDVAGLSRKLRTRMEAELAAEDTLAERKRLALAGVHKLQELCRPLDEALKAIHPRPELDISGDKLTHTMLSRSDNYGPSVVFSYERASKIVSNVDLRRYAFAYGRGLALREDGYLRLQMYVMVHFEEVLGVDFSWESAARTAQVGSIEAERMLEEGIRELAPQLEKGLAVFVEKVPSA